MIAGIASDLQLKENRHCVGLAFGERAKTASDLQLERRPKIRRSNSWKMGINCVGLAAGQSAKTASNLQLQESLHCVGLAAGVRT
jgi:hypothetical protein